MAFACGGEGAPPSSTIDGAGGGGDGEPSGSAGAQAGGGTAGVGPEVGGPKLGNGGKGPIILNGGSGGGVGACKTQADCEENQCGPIADGCGDVVDCGQCGQGQACGTAGPSLCGPASGTCTPATCESLGAECGQQPDGCGDSLDCSTCSAGQECVAGQCETLASCTLKSCADYALETGLCGPVSDGCGGTLDCGFACSAGQLCGVSQPGQCGTATCTPFTCVEALANLALGYCGPVADGCGGLLEGCAPDCGSSCDAGAGGPDAGSCGSGGGGSCTPLTTADCGSVECGVISDGCSGVVDCGTCPLGQACGLTTAGQCGTVACVPYTCLTAGAECGSIPDGCGATIDCGDTCTGGDTCGGAGTPNQCGSPTCEPMDQAAACAAASADCGPVSDGCDGQIPSCGTCSGGDTCGGGGTPSQCGTSCTPDTCGDIGASCGPQGDGCGGQIDCGNCDPGFACQGNPSSCVATEPCDNFCQQQATCDPGEETRVTGRVYAPNGTEPLYNALVYVPNIADLANLPSITTGPTCERCEDEDLGEPLVATITGPDGSFSLDNIPSGVDFPLVVKMGKWRRVVMIPAVADCSDNVLSVDDARLPRHKNDAAAGLTQHVNIPHIAMVTGKVDAIECVLRKIGVADSEFTGPAGSGRVHIFKGENGAEVSGSTDTVSDLFAGSSPALDDYDVAIFDCEGDYNGSKSDTRRDKLEAFADAGGRVFASHYAYRYLEGDNLDGGPSSFESTGEWGGDEFGEAGLFTVNNNPTTGIIDVSHAKGQAFNAWLGNVDAYHDDYGNGYISIIDPRGYVASVPAVGQPASLVEQFVTLDADHVVPGYSGTGPEPNGDINDFSSVQQYAFNTPVGASSANVCGRVVYSAFHVTGDGNPNYDNDTFPDHCDTGPLTPQEKALEFMIFDLSACVSTSAPPSCTPQTCGDLGATCGFLSDGCGGIQDCGTCTAPESCGGGGTPNQCGSSCALATCGSVGANCGIIADGCGGTVDCGDCTAPAVCGGGGTSNVCGTPACTPRTCGSVGAECGALADGCGGTIDCGTCPGGQFCGGDGPNQCGTGSCTPQTCEQAIDDLGGQFARCGAAGDGCGGVLDCGTCPSGYECGAAGPNLCGAVCNPTTCQAAGANCGFIGDGCGGVVDCGTCPSGQTCGGGGTPSQCGGSCTPITCQSAGAACGTVADGCGGVLNCGTCPTGQVCGATQANQCGAGSCTPSVCGTGDCGLLSDGCSGLIDCGACTSGGGCTPLTCQEQNADCGPVADGCGGLLDCGICTVAGETCGGGGTPSRCGAVVIQ